MILTFRSVKFQGGSYMKAGGAYARSFTATSAASVVTSTVRRGMRAGALTTPYTGYTNSNPNSPLQRF